MSKTHEESGVGILWFIGMLVFGFLTLAVSYHVFFDFDIRYRAWGDWGGVFVLIPMTAMATVVLSQIERGETLHFCYGFGVSLFTTLLLPRPSCIEAPNGNALYFGELAIVSLGSGAACALCAKYFGRKPMPKGSDQPSPR